MCVSDKKRPCSCSESKKKRVKHGRRPLPDLNYPPPPDNHQQSSSSSPSSSSSSSRPHNYDKLLGIAHEHSPAAASRKRKMGERERESESSSHWIKACWNTVMNYIISNPNKKKKKKKDDPAQ